MNLITQVCVVCGEEFEYPVKKSTCCDSCRDILQRQRDREFCIRYYSMIHEIIHSNPDFISFDKRYFHEEYRDTLFRGTHLEKYKNFCRVVNSFAREYDLPVINRFVFRITKEYRDKASLDKPVEQCQVS